MNHNGHSRVSEVVKKYESDLLKEWMEQQLATITLRSDLMKESELREQSRHFLTLFTAALQNGNSDDIRSRDWAAVREMLTTISVSRARQGFSPSETAAFVFSLKQPLFERLQQSSKEDSARLVEEIGTINLLLDKLGLFTTEIYQQNREQVISRQQQELMELSTPVVRLWEGVLAVPLIGTLDSARTQVVMENLLQRIMETGAPITIIDITGVPVVDTLVAQHLLKTVAAARLMGADCIISGIRPQIAQTIVHLGVDLSAVITKATLADAFILALKRVGFSVTRTAPRD
jgi:rsbT co-antagonist protein RsbR